MTIPPATLPHPAQGHLSLQLDPGAEVDRIAAALRHQLRDDLQRRGLVLGMSGGVDSSVCAALAVRALGPRRVFALFMPERDSDPASLELASEWAGRLGIDHATEDITPLLEAARCYERRDEAIRRLVPEFGAGWLCKVVLPAGRVEGALLNVPSLVVQPPAGEPRTLRLPSAEYRQIVAATNFKQRVRKMVEYYHADRLHYAVVGTPNRLEYDQGFFVKGGDGLADVKPIAHLYKTQVYQLAEFLGVPAAVQERAPTTDTYSMPQGQDEFYFALPARQMDVVLHARNAGLSEEDAAQATGLSVGQVRSVYRDIDQKRNTTRYLHLTPRLVEPVPPISAH